MEGCMEIRCKRIIDGKTYNTETATQIACSITDSGPGELTEYLYQNRFGAFFIYRNLSGWEEQDGEQLIPFSPEQAREWLEKRTDGADHIEALFGAMPEAGSGEIKFTLRLPESLRDRLAALAKENTQSLNAWMVRCLERCASPTDASKS